MPLVMIIGFGIAGLAVALVVAFIVSEVRDQRNVRMRGIAMLRESAERWKKYDDTRNR